MPRNDGNTQKRETKNMKKPTNKGFQNSGKFNNKDGKDYKKKNNQKPPTVNATTKKDAFVAKRPEGVYGRAYEYRMSKLCANEILKECPSRIRPQQYLCDFVTEQYGLMGWCCRVIIEG